MLRTAVTLDAAMNAGEALDRLAKNGYWLDPNDPAAVRWLDAYLSRLRKFDVNTMTREDAAALLASPVADGRVVIRRQDGVTIFWYARRIFDVLRDLGSASPAAPVVDALGLHEYTSDQAEQINALDRRGAENFVGVALNGPQVFGVGERSDRDNGKRSGQGTVRSGTVLGTAGRSESVAPAAAAPASVPAPARAGAGEPAPTSSAPARDLRVFPFIDAPPAVAVGQQFALDVGLSETAMAGIVVSMPVVVPVPAGAKGVNVDVHVVADNFDVIDGWRRTLQVDPAAPGNARLQFLLVAKAQDTPVRLTSFVVHYSVNGVACGIASRYVVVGRTLGDVPPPDDRGQNWLDAEPPAPGIVLGPAQGKPDVELDIAKPDANVANGDYLCFFRNAHGVPVPDQSFPIRLGDDSETFAKNLIDEMRRWSGKPEPVLNRLLENIGVTVADKLPQEFWKMLAAVAAKVQGRPLTLQLSSAEPFVPWELAVMDSLIDPSRPPFLGTQVVMGRWILGDSRIAAPPKASVSVKAMAVMAGMYSVTSGLRPLPKAQEEARELSKSFAALPAVPLDCTAANLDLLLEGTLSLNFAPIDGVQVVHFAGHGEVDPTRPGDAALFLSNGSPLNPMFLRRSRLGTTYAPFLFLNACMVGTGGKMLGDYGGFPGNSLAGGFTALLAPLWAVNDDVAKEFALEFYKEALTKGGNRPVAEVVRDLRCKYQKSAPVPSFLAYVFYGNPALVIAQ